MAPLSMEPARPTAREALARQWPNHDAHWGCAVSAEWSDRDALVVCSCGARLLLRDERGFDLKAALRNVPVIQ